MVEQEQQSIIHTEEQPEPMPSIWTRAVGRATIWLRGTPEDRLAKDLKRLQQDEDNRVWGGMSIETIRDKLLGKLEQRTTDPNGRYRNGEIDYTFVALEQADNSETAILAQAESQIEGYDAVVLENFRGPNPPVRPQVYHGAVVTRDDRLTTEWQLLEDPIAKHETVNRVIRGFERATARRHLSRKEQHTTSHKPIDLRVLIDLFS